MATVKKVKTEKLTTAQIKDLDGVSIKGVTTVEEARKEMIAYLNKQEIDDVDEETYEELYDMVEAIYDDTDAALDAAAEEVEDEEEDEVDDSEEEDDDEDDDEDEVDDSEEEDDSDEVDDEVDDLEDTAEKEEKANDKVQKKTETTAKKATEKKEKAKGTKKPSKRLNPLENKEDAARYDELKKVLGADFEYNFIANGGVSIKYLGKNSKKVFLSFDSPKVDKDGEVVGRVYLSSVKDEEVLQELFGEDIETKKSWSGNILIIGMSISDLASSLKTNKKAFDDVIHNLTKKDEKLGKNRAKMEEDLKKENQVKATKAKSAKK